MRRAYGLAVAVLALAGCPDRDAPDRAPEEVPPTPAEEEAVLSPPAEEAPGTPDGLGDRSEEERLLLVDEVPLGLSYQEVRARLPALGPLRSEVPGAGPDRLTEADLSTRVLDRTARLEFNFRRDTLYSFYFMVSEAGCPDARSLYERLQEFYAARFGAPQEEVLREPGYEARSSFWRADDFEVVGTLGVQAETCRVGWGFQEQAAFHEGNAARNPAGEPGIRITVFRPNLRPRAELAGPWTRHPSSRDAGELLRVLPGVDAVRRGSLGLDPVVRGLRESQVGIYLDGTRMLPASPSRMDSPLGHLDPAAVREIEVVRGPYALTWGAGNLSAIRMETRELPPDLRGELWMSLATGYDSNQRAVKTAGSFFGWSGPVSYLAHGSWRRGDDYESGSGEVVPAAFRSGEGRGKVAVDLAPGSRLTLSAGYREQGRTDYPGTLLNAESIRTVSVSGRWRLERMGDLGPSGAPGSFPLLRAVELLAYSNHADHEGTNRDKPTALPDPDRFPPWAMDLRSTSSVVVTGARAAAELTPGPGWTAEAGADLFRAHGDGVRTLSRLDDGVLVLEDLLWPAATVVDGGLFFRLARAVGGRGNVAGALRLDLVRADADTASAFFRENVSAEPRATEANLSAAASFDVGLGSAWTLSAGLGSAVRTADATERYSDRSPSSRAHTIAEFVGDPALRPERSTQADLSLEGTYPGVVLRLDAFLRRVDDYITARPTDLPRRFPLSPAPVFRYANGEAVFRGLEASAGYAFRPPLTLRVAGSYLWGEDRTLEEPVLGISPLQGSLALRYEDLGSRFFGEGSASLAANQERVAATLGELPTRGYTTLDVRGGFRPLTGLELRLGIENLTDAEVVNHLNARDPFTGRQLREPGRSLSADLTFAF